MFEQPFSANHVSSKQKGFSGLAGSNNLGTMNKGQWSDVLQVRWCTVDPPNLNSHPLFAKLLSSLSQMVCPSLKYFFHVNGLPLNPISMKPHSSMVSLNSCIGAWLQF